MESLAAPNNPQWHTFDSALQINSTADDAMDLEQATTSSLRTSLESVSIPSDSPRAGFSNWAKTFHCKPERVFAPTTVEHCRSIVELARREGARLHPVGVGHSPSDLACTNGWLMRMEGVKGLINVSSRLSQYRTFVFGRRC